MPEALKREREDEAPPTERKERKSKAFPIALGVGAVVAVVAGLLLGGGGGEEEAPPPPSTQPVQPVAAGAVQLKLPEDYAEVTPAPEIPGLALDPGSVYAPGGRDGGQAIALGQAQANDSTLLPAEFRGATGFGDAEAPEREPVRLGPDGALQAYRYENLQPDGFDRQVTVFAVPTSEGVATVACLAPPAQAGAFKPVCDGVANTLEVASGEPFPVGPNAEYAKTLSATLGALDGKVAKGTKALGRDGAQFDDQAKAARDIQAAYAAAAKRLRNASISPADETINGALAKSLANSSAAWKRAARAAARKDKAGFDRSEAAIRKAQQQLAQALDGMKIAGYNVE
jgi:hypothetical protein